MSKLTILEPKNLDEAMRFAEMLSKSGMVPTAFQGKPANVLVAIQWGYELSLAPMQALQNISVINGKPSIWGDSMLALVKAHPAFRGISETIEGEVASCEVKREMTNGEIETTVGTFSINEAKRAGLLGKAGPWKTYPQRMLKLRARGFALRDSFPDAIKGLITTEEASDYPAESATPPEQPVEKPVIPAEANTPAEILEALSESKTESVEVDSQVYVFHVPGRESTEFNDELGFIDAYSHMMNRVDKNEKILPADRRTKLKALEEANADTFSLLDASVGEQLHEKRLQMNKVLSMLDKEQPNEK